MTARAWALDAACAQTDPDAFYPNKGEPNRAAKAICDRCPVRAECLEWALQHNEVEGVWGGTSPRERALLRRSRGIPPRNVRIAAERAAWVRAALAWGVDPVDAAQALGIDLVTVNRYAAITGEGAGA